MTLSMERRLVQWEQSVLLCLLLSIYSNIAILLLYRMQSCIAFYTISSLAGLVQAPRSRHMLDSRIQCTFRYVTWCKVQSAHSENIFLQTWPNGIHSLFAWCRLSQGTRKIKFDIFCKNSLDLVCTIDIGNWYPLVGELTAKDVIFALFIQAL